MLELLLDGQLVGYFREPKWPVAPGRYRYEPYRGSAHALLHEELRSGRRPECSYLAGSTSVVFVVIGSPAYGVLELTDFRAERGELPR